MSNNTGCVYCCHNLCRQHLTLHCRPLFGCGQFSGWQTKSGGPYKRRKILPMLLMPLGALTLSICIKTAMTNLSVPRWWDLPVCQMFTPQTIQNKRGERGVTQNHVIGVTGRQRLPRFRRTMRKREKSWNRSVRCLILLLHPCPRGYGESLREMQKREVMRESHIDLEPAPERRSKLQVWKCYNVRADRESTLGKRWVLQNAELPGRVKAKRERRSSTIGWWREIEAEGEI